MRAQQQYRGAKGLSGNAMFGEGRQQRLNGGQFGSGQFYRARDGQLLDATGGDVSWIKAEK